MRRRLRSQAVRRDLVGFAILIPGSRRISCLGNVKIQAVPQTAHMAAIWRASTPLSFGSHASIRRASQSHDFPILKLAHGDELCIKLIQHEFEILANLTKSTAAMHVVEVDLQPIEDGGIVCGYRMKELFQFELSDWVRRAHDIKFALSCLHSTGFCHGDLSPSNVMKDSNGRIILIVLALQAEQETPFPVYSQLGVFQPHF